jgi:hypothetical protein
MKHYPCPQNLAAKHLGGWCVYVHTSYTGDEPAEVTTALEEAFPDIKQYIAVIFGGMFHFDTEEEADEFFAVFNRPPLYASGYYAMLYKDGDPIDENT